MSILRTLGTKVAERLLPKTEAAAGCARECWCVACLFGGTNCSPSGGGANPCVKACCEELNCKIYCHQVL
ncbi:hypothetical protein [Streptomyces prasinus]|uniref:hypothetical protein n=1 Tax=Streptomyces prasinus TaxID=67345 RepID=UPI000A63876C|nr:hypothetical protein [Streptomyces prasinus]